MPPVVIDIRSAEDTRDVVHRAVQALAEGQLVAFPTETVYGVAACTLREDAVRRLGELGVSGPLELAVKSADEALDFVPDISPLAKRLARRCWPGPVTLLLQDSSQDSLIRQLPESSRAAVSHDGCLAMRVPAHSLIHEVLRLLPGPVALAGAGREPDCDAVTAADVVGNVGERIQLVLDDGRSRYGQPSSLVKVGQRSFEVLRPGVVSEQTLRRLSSLMVLFVCTGNTCRSPMAETMFRKLMADKLGCQVNEVHDRGVVVASAGLSAMMGGRPTSEAVHVMARLGLDLGDHESQPMTEHLAQQSDFIFAMTRSHRHAILSEWPGVGDRVRLLCHDRNDVADPIGGPPEMYERCAMQIKAELEAWAAELEV
jgi:protein-tyrosine phosphatase